MTEKTLTCENCQTELPARVYEAGTKLYAEPETWTGELLAGHLERQIGNRLDGDTDENIVRRAIRDLLDDMRPEDMIAAAGHYGFQTRGTEGSECERIAWARWCHEPTPGWQGAADGRPPTCSLPANHEGLHDFEPIIPDFEAAS